MEHYYVGRRPRDPEVYVVSRAAIEPLAHHGYRSSAALDWGAPTAGALELAYATLAHTAESLPPDSICTTFWTDVVAYLDRPGFVLAHSEIALWLLTTLCNGAQAPPSHRRLTRMRQRVIRRFSGP